MKNLINIYLDIDGVLLLNDWTIANHANEFIAYILENYPDSTYWLTTHCKGDANTPIQNVGHLFKPETIELMKKIKPTNWKFDKTDAIDYSKPFLWFDDNLYPREKETLINNNALENWIGVNLLNNENQLARFMDNFPLPKGLYDDN